MRNVANLGCVAIVLGGFLFGTVVRAEDRPAPKKDAPKNDDLMAQLMARFDAWDTNKDGVLDMEELTKALGEARAKQVLQRYDTNKDGKLSREEYMAWARRYAAEIKSRQQGDQPKPRG
jgi:hypothetical protein